MNHLKEPKIKVDKIIENKKIFNKGLLFSPLMNVRSILLLL